jgi:NADH:ubiquinone oxidoreductase subunit 3 (subunit A)
MSSSTFNNNQDSTYTSANILSLETLQQEYSNALLNYQKASQTLINDLQKSSGKTNLITLPGTVNMGNGQDGWLNGNGQNVASGSECMALCENTPGCSGATYNSDTQNCIIRSGEVNAIPYKSNYTSYVEKSKVNLTNVQMWNNRLIDIIQQINSIVINETPYYEGQMQEQNTNTSSLKTDLAQLLEEQAYLNNAVQEYESNLNSRQETGLNTSQHYTQYIFYAVVLFFIIILFLKIVIFPKSSGTQSGGGSSSVSKMSDILFLLGLMVVFLGLGYIFKEKAGFIIVFIIIFLLVLVKMRLIPNFIRF